MVCDTTQGVFDLSKNWWWHETHSPWAIKVLLSFTQTSSVFDPPSKELFQSGRCVGRTFPKCAAAAASLGFSEFTFELDGAQRVSASGEKWSVGGIFHPDEICCGNDSNLFETFAKHFRWDKWSGEMILRVSIFYNVYLAVGRSGFGSIY